jgi:hypothetical protein
VNPRPGLQKRELYIRLGLSDTHIHGYWRAGHIACGLQPDAQSVGHTTHHPQLKGATLHLTFPNDPAGQVRVGRTELGKDHGG